MVIVYSSAHVLAAQRPRETLLRIELIFILKRNFLIFTKHLFFITLLSYKFIKQTLLLSLPVNTEHISFL